MQGSPLILEKLYGTRAACCNPIEVKPVKALGAVIVSPVSAVSQYILRWDLFAMVPAIGKGTK
jgi:hypothetical protein